MSFIVPTISMSGVFTLELPFQSKLLKDTVYQCVAIRRIDELMSAGIDPFTVFYGPESLTITRYEDDVAKGVMIVSLKAIGTQEIVHVPTSYILSCPKAGGVAYTVMGLSFSIGAVPNTTDLNPMKDKLVTMVKETLGIDTTVNVLALSPTTIVDTTVHNGLVATRNESIVNTPTDHSLYLATLSELNNAKQKILELETYIMNLNPQ